MLKLVFQYTSFVVVTQNILRSDFNFCHQLPKYKLDLEKSICINVK